MAQVHEPTVPLQFPFGPASCEELPEKEFRDLFLKANRSIMNAVDFSTIIVGRRGSGKSSALNYAKSHAKYWATCSIDTLEVYFNLRAHISGKEELKILRQRASVMWEKIIYDYVAIELFAKLSEKNSSEQPSPAQIALMAELEAYSNSLEADTPASGADKKPSAFRIAFQLAKSAAKFLTKDFGGSGPELTAALEDLQQLWFNFENMKRKIDRYLADQGLTILVCIDMLDELLLSDEAVRLIAAGQLNCLNRFKTSSSRIDVKCVMPEEMLPELQSLAISVDKDFSSVSFIRWNESDLMCLVVLRYLHFLKKRFPDAELTQQLSAKVSEGKHEEGFYLVFPAKIQNALGGEERTGDFLIRQTQCLPRQLINICNSIANTHFASVGTAVQVLAFDAESVVAGIAENQSIICNSVFGANFDSSKFPREQIEWLLRRLKRKFSYAEFESALLALTSEPENKSSTEETLDHLIDMGVVGVWLNDQMGFEQYNVTQFKYLSVWRPFFKSTSMFCLHPAFSGLYTSETQTGDRATLPFGSPSRFVE
jgi:disulfide oxidoreductase YuzD